METIKNINIWQSNKKDMCTHINTIEEFLNYLDTNNTLDFTIYEKHIPKEEQKVFLDRIADNNNIIITYTDNEHNVTIIDLGVIGKDIVIHPDFYNKYKEQIIEFCKKKLREKAKTSPISLYIPDILLSNETVDFLTQEERLTDTTIKIINTTGINLTEEQIKKIKEANLEFYHQKQQISTNKLIGFYTKKDLKEKESISISPTITDKEIENLIYLNENCKISIETFQIDEYEHIDCLKRICNILSKHNRNYHIHIEIDNRELLIQSGILKVPNIKFTIHNDLYEYKQEEFLAEDAKLEELIKPIRESKLSPYEKYLAVYNIVKQFKPYKENEANKNESRYLRYILNNEYMVCVGYSKLLKTLLDKVGIPSMEISVGVDVSYDDGFTMTETPTQIEGHARNIIKINDPKYKINGIFVVDSTWDNDMEIDLYNNSSMTFDRKKEAKRMESLASHDLLLDFHNFEEFTKKLNFKLRRTYNRIGTYSQNAKRQEKLIRAYQDTYKEIMEILINLDYPKYTELHTKYHEQITKNNITLPEIEKICSDFLTEYAMYILPLSNRKISDRTILRAAVNVKKTMNKTKDKSELVELRKKLEKIQKQVNKVSFPYSYDPNNPIPNFLETQEQAKKNKK